MTNRIEKEVLKIALIDFSIYCQCSDVCQFTKSRTFEIASNILIVNCVHLNLFSFFNLVSDI